MGKVTHRPAPRRILHELLKTARRKCAKGIHWRFQPKGCELNHKSMAYCLDFPDIDGVWAFPGLANAISNLYDHSESYARGEAGRELVAICPTFTADGPEDFVRIHGGKIIARFDSRRVAGDLGVKWWAHKEGLLRWISTAATSSRN